MQQKKTLNQLRPTSVTYVSSGFNTFLDGYLFTLKLM